MTACAGQALSETSASVSRVRRGGNRIEIPVIERNVLSGSWRGLEEGSKVLKMLSLIISRCEKHGDHRAIHGGQHSQLYRQQHHFPVVFSSPVPVINTHSKVNVPQALSMNLAEPHGCDELFQ